MIRQAKQMSRRSQCYSYSVASYYTIYASVLEAYCSKLVPAEAGVRNARKCPRARQYLLSNASILTTKTRSRNGLRIRYLLALFGQCSDTTITTTGAS